MVKISDCSCECRDRGKERRIEERALSSINKVLGTEGQAYYPDGTGAVTIPIADASDLANAKEVPQIRISVDENTAHLTTVDRVLDDHAREIKANSDEIAGLETVTDALTKELPTDFRLYKPSAGKIQLQYETEDQSLLNSNILDMVIPESYDIISGSTSRSFKLKIQFSDGTTATTNDFVIPEGGGTSVSVTGITLTKSGNALKTSIVLNDGSTIESGTVQMVGSVSGTFANKQLTITVNGVSSLPIGIDVGAGGSYTAGAGIDISSTDVISVDTTVIATKSELNTLKDSVGDAIKPFGITESDTGLTIKMESLDGQENSVVIPTVGGNLVGLIDNASFTMLQYFIYATSLGYYSFEIDDDGDYIVPSVDGTTISYNSNNQLQVIGGGSSSKKFVETDTNYSSPVSLLDYLVTLDVGTMVTLYMFGKTSSSPCGTLTGIVKSTTDFPTKRVSITYTGGTFHNGSEVVVVGAINYNVQPYFNIGLGDEVELWIPEVKGNSVHGATYTMSSSFQGYSVAIFN